MVLSLTFVPEDSQSILISFRVIIGSFLIFFSKCRRDRRPLIPRGAHALGKLPVVPYSLDLSLGIIQPTVEYGRFTCVEIFLYEIPSERSGIICYQRYCNTSRTLGVISLR